MVYQRELDRAAGLMWKSVMSQERDIVRLYELSSCAPRTLGERTLSSWVIEPAAWSDTLWLNMTTRLVASMALYE